MTLRVNARQNLAQILLSGGGGNRTRRQPPALPGVLKYDTLTLPDQPPAEPGAVGFNSRTPSGILTQRWLLDAHLGNTNLRHEARRPQRLQ